MNKKILAIALSAGIVLAGCGNAQDKKDVENKVETKVKDAKSTAKDVKDKVETDVKEATSDINEVKLDIDQAVAKFKETFSDEEIAIEDIKLELENGNYEYEIEGRKDNKEYSLTLDANSGEIKAQKEEDDNENEAAKPIDFKAIISPSEAMAKALEGQDGAKVVEWSLSEDDAKTVYEIDVDGGNDKKVDALTGEVLDD